MKKLKRKIGYFIWTLTEILNISLGKLDPIVLGWMIGAKPVKVDKED